jgi:hypothetical protein
MALRPNSHVIAARNIKREGDVVVTEGTPGLIVGLGGFVTVKYRVKFMPRRGVTVIVDRLTWRDVRGA